jgi:uncharacterized membrane protein
VPTSTHHPSGGHGEAGIDEYIGDPATSGVTGMPGRGVALSSTVATAACAGLDVALTGHLTLFFDLCFVVVCLVGAMGVSRADFFAVGVLPPGLFAATVAALSVLSPPALSVTGTLSHVFLTGLTGHAGALVAGYAVALLTIGARLAAERDT